LTLTKIDGRPALLWPITDTWCPNRTWVRVCGAECGSRWHSEAPAVSGHKNDRSGRSPRARASGSEAPPHQRWRGRSRARHLCSVRFPDLCSPPAQCHGL